MIMAPPVVAATFTGHADPAADLAPWSVMAGRTAGDAIAQLFRLPLPAPILAVSLDAVRCEVSVSLARLSPELADDEASRLVDLAWLAFDDALTRHAALTMQAGRP